MPLLLPTAPRPTAWHHLINAIALQIRKVQNGPIEYLACARRDPLLLTFHLKTIRALLSDLSKHIYRKIPQSIYSHHYRTAERIEEQLVALQGGFTLSDDHGDQETPIRRSVYQFLMAY
jgi:hypothetical protein